LDLTNIFQGVVDEASSKQARSNLLDNSRVINDPLEDIALGPDLGRRLWPSIAGNDLVDLYRLPDD
jgi:hypothetical protein